MPDLLDEILAKLPKPAATTPPATPASGTPPTPPPAAPPAGKPPTAGTPPPAGKPPATGTQPEEGEGELPHKPGGQRIHNYGPQFKETFGERKT